ncbi:ABC transporter permease [Brevibacillus daliensis]|uniref:ABC transporter permease n=1 Tax=Brevibacillus daliensis TaxID=2892995 RepID=UPI001E406EC0|nr:ABC-2 family transporter protein [Brevibacillus daliensis]
MIYMLLAVKTYKVNLQYRMAHLVHNLGSCIFCFVYMAIWTGILSGREEMSPYGLQELLFYLTSTQCLLWLTTFLSPGLQIHLWVRSGDVSMYLARPVHFYLYTISQEMGRISYNFFYRSIPIYLILGFAVGFHTPDEPLTLLWYALSSLFAIIIGLNFFYIVGITSFWTTEVRWAMYLNQSLILMLGGQMLPLEFYPEPFASILINLPFASILYIPSMILLEKLSYDMLGLQLFWCVVLIAFNVTVTQFARRRVEIQGG